MKKFGLALIVVIALVAFGAFWFFSRLDALIESAIEDGGSQATETAVSVDDVVLTFGREESQASILGFQIANPVGFSKANAFSLKEISLVLNVQDSSREVIVVKELKIVEPFIKYEMGPGGSNIETIKKSINENTSSAGGSPSGGDPARQVRFIVERLVITKGEVNVASSSGEIASSDLPAITMTGIGVQEGGVSGPELGRIIIGRLTEEAIKATAKGAIRDLLGGVTDKLDGLFNR